MLTGKQRVIASDLRDTLSGLDRYMAFLDIPEGVESAKRMLCLAKARRHLCDSIHTIDAYGETR